MEYKSFPQKYFNPDCTNKASSFSVADLEKSMSSYRMKYLKKFILDLPQGAKVLDLGSGTGKASVIVKTYRPDLIVYATDISDLGRYFPDDIIFKQGSAEELKKMYDQDLFDAVISLHLLEHLVFPMELMDGVRYILKKGGKLYIETPNWTRIFMPFSYMFFYGDYTHVRPYSVFAIAKLLVEFQLKPLVIKTVRSHTWFSKTNHFIKKENKFVSSVVTANESRGIGMRLVGKILDPLVRDIIVAIGEKQ